MFRSILVAVDGSECATKALEHAVDLAQSEGARLTLITVVTPPHVPVAGPYLVTIPTEDELERHAQKILDEAEARVPEGVPVSTVLRRGPSAAPEILKRVEDGEHDLVVMGSRGRGATTSLLLGSVGHTVLDHSPVPVLIVRRRSGKPASGRPDVTTA